jgi:NAD(P)-dependent dehydrogenase (short-subunit alcohol dehydrogenase family)
MANENGLLQDKVVVVTGASRGIGRKVAETCAADGARVFVVSRNSDAVTAVARAIGKNAHPFAMDVRREDAVQDLSEEVKRLYGGCDLLVNNAAVMMPGEIATFPTLDFLDTLHTNVLGPFLFMREFLPLLAGRAGATIVNIASLAPTAPNPKLGAYAASKAALLALSEALREEVREEGIRVAVLLPGSVRTSLHHRELTDDDAWMLDPEDIADAVLDVYRAREGALFSRVEVRPLKKREREPRTRR